MIERNLLKEAEMALKRSPAIVILGPRQVGKTTLAKKIAQNSTLSSIYLDTENPRDQQKLKDAYTYLDNLKNKRVIVDEIQLIPELFSILRPLIDVDRKNGRFILLGSASPALVKGVSESLAGRVSYLELTPVGLSELPSKIAMRKHWFRGGFPEALLAKNDIASQDWLDDFIRSYTERELGYLFGVNLMPVLLRNFWSMLAHSNGNIWNTEIFARSLGISAPTVARYADFLEGGYLIRRLHPWHINIKKRIVKSPKIYIRDSGILHRLLNVANEGDLAGYPGVGASWEGYVIEQIYQRKPKKLNIFFYRTHAGAESDLVLVSGIEPVACIEIKLSNSPQIPKGFLNSVEDLQPKAAYIITPESETYPAGSGVIVTNLREFIFQKLPLL